MERHLEHAFQIGEFIDFKHPIFGRMNGTRPTQLHRWLAGVVVSLRPEHVLEIDPGDGLTTLSLLCMMPHLSTLTAVDRTGEFGSVPPDWLSDPRLNLVVADPESERAYDSIRIMGINTLMLNDTRDLDRLNKLWELCEPLLAPSALVILRNTNLRNFAAADFLDGIVYPKLDLSERFLPEGLGVFVCKE